MTTKPARAPVAYPPTLAPDLWDPKPAAPGHRFALGRMAHGSGAPNPLFVLGMNPSYADEVASDVTVNRVIAASAQLGYSGWLMLNLYPERASSPAKLHAFDQAMSDDNCSVIEYFINEFGVREIFGAWGDLPNATIRRAKPPVLRTVASLGARIFYFGQLTGKGEPRHLNPRRGKLDLSAPKNSL
jgi:hypothetical protein